MNEPFSTNSTGPKKISVWTEGARIEPKEYVVLSKKSDNSEDIPTIPDLDDLQDLLEKEVSKYPTTDPKDKETANTLAEVGGGFGTSVEGIDGVMEVLKSQIPKVEMDSADVVWSIDSLLMQLSQEEEEAGT